MPGFFSAAARRLKVAAGGGAHLTCLRARGCGCVCVCERARAREAARLFVCLVPSECTRTLRAHAHVSTRTCAVGAWLCLHVRLCACAYVLKCVRARARYILCVSVRARNGSISRRALSSACWACIRVCVCARARACAHTRTGVCVCVTSCPGVYLRA